MKKKRYLALGVVLVAAMAIGLTGAGYAHSRGDSSEQSASEAHYRGERGDRDQERYLGASKTWRGGHERRSLEDGLEYSEAEDRDEYHEDEGEDRDDESSDRSDRTTTTAAPNTPNPPTTPTTAAPTTTTTGSPNAPNPPTTPTTAAPTTTTAGINAAALYSQNCSNCHGNPATESRFANRTQSQIASALTSGSMRSYASSMTAAEITAVAAYVANGGN